MRKILYVFLIVGQTLPVLAQEPLYLHYQNFDERDGYKVFEEISFITQDQKGLLWIGSDNGLFSFDGTHFKNYRHRKNDSTSLPANFVFYNYQDKQGVYWTAVPNKGLYNFHPQTGTFSRFRYSNEKEFNIHEQSIYLPIEAKNGILWFPLPYFGIARYDRQNDKIIPYRICPPGSCGSYYNASLITQLAEDPDDGTLWAASNDGLVHFDPSNGRFVVYRDSIKSKDRYKVTENIYTCVFFDEQKQLWLGSWGAGLKTFNRNTQEFEEYRWAPVFTGTKNIVYNIGQYDKDHLWVNTEEGLQLFGKKAARFTAVRGNGEETSTLMANKVMQNHNGVLWLASTKSLMRINPGENNFRFYSLQKLFAKAPTAGGLNAFARHGQSLFTAVLYDGFLAEYNLQNYHSQVYLLSNNLNRGIRCLAKREDGTIWIGSALGVTTFDAETKKFRQPSSPENDPGLFRRLTYAILHDEDGTVWLGTAEGLVHYNPAQKIARRFNYDTSGQKQVADNKYYRHTYSLHKDSRGNIWFGNAVVGLGCYRRATDDVVVFNKGRNSTYPEGSCRSITEAGDGSILFALENVGLCILRQPFTPNENITVLNASDGLPSDNVSRVFRDKDGNIWLFTTNGLCWFDPVKNRVRRFGKEDGLAENNLHSKPYQDEEGNIYLGFARTFQVFHPKALLMPENDTGFIHLASLQINGKNWPVAPDDVRSLRLKHDQTNINFAFAFLSANHTAGFTYAYRLEGLDRGWNYTGDKTSGQYNNLSPGNYTLRIKAMHRNGEWSKNEYALPVIVQPPWYGTVWFYTAIAVLALFLIMAMFRYRIQQIKRESRLKATFTKKLHEIEMRALRAQMNPHFIFNCLNSINRYIVKSDHKTASGYLTKFAKLIRLILDNSASESITLDKEIQTLQLYVDMEKLRFDNVFEYMFEVDEAFLPETVFIPSMLLQPYVENAIWHGLLHKEEGEGMLWIRFRQQDEKTLMVEVEDNGIGRQKAKELKSKEVVRKKSYGMQISKDRISLINELYNLDAAVQVEDLTNERGEAKGTKVIIQIPVKNGEL